MLQVASCQPHSTMVTSTPTMDIMASLPILHPMALDLHTDMDRQLAMVPNKLLVMELDMDLVMVLTMLRDMVRDLLRAMDHQTRVLVTMAKDHTLLWILKEMRGSKAPEISVIWFMDFLL